MEFRVEITAGVGGWHDFESDIVGDRKSGRSRRNDSSRYERLLQTVPPLDDPRRSAVGVSVRQPIAGPGALPRSSHPGVAAVLSPMQSAVLGAVVMGAQVLSRARTIYAYRRMQQCLLDVSPWLY
jgi:hypothetical protein